MKSTKHLRWYIAGLLCLATIINYVDRQTWSLTTPIISNVIIQSFSKSDVAKVKTKAAAELRKVEGYDTLTREEMSAVVDKEYARQQDLIRVGKVPDEKVLKAMPASTKTLYDPIRKALDDRTKALIAFVLMAFEIGYILGPTPLGWLLDRIGTRRGYPITMALWSAAGILTIFAMQMGNIIDKFCHLTVIPVVIGFAFCRFILGVGEAGNWPAAIKTIGEWFPAKERSLAMGIFNSGSSVGAFVAPFIIYALVRGNNWQPPYIVTGLFGFVWIAIWLYLYHAPEKHPRLSKEEYAYITSDRPATDRTDEPSKLPWYEGLKYRQVRGVLLSRFCAENVWKFSMYWLPLYFTQVRGVQLSKMFIFVALTALSSELGNLVGGWLSSHFIKIGWTINKARKSVMAPCGVVMISALLVPQLSLNAAVAVLCLITFCYQAWSVNMQTIPADVVPRQALGATAGLAHITAGLAGFATSMIAGLLSFDTAFYFLGVAAALAVLFLFVAIGRIDPEVREQNA